MNSDVILKTRALSKSYASRHFFAMKKIVAVDHLDLDVMQGEILGFLGPNGAGKTTTLNMLVGVVEPSQGTIEIFHQPFKAGDVEPLRRIGYVPESTVLPGYFSVEEILDFYAQLFRIPKRLRTQRRQELLERVGLWKERRRLIKNLSMGQRRLVDFMQALINDPEIILLDEPTVYLDPVIMERFRRILTALREEGKTIIMSSHVLPEVERFSDRLAVIDKGKLLKVGPKKDFMQAGSVEEEFLRIVRDVS